MVTDPTSSHFSLVGLLVLALAGCSAEGGHETDVPGEDVDVVEVDTVEADTVEVDTSAADTLFVFHDTVPPEDTFEPADTRFDTSPVRACEEDADCAWCATPKAPSATSTCACFSCNAGVVPVADCEANAAAWKALCDDRDADGDLCPVLECKPPGPVECRGATCRAVEE